MFGSSSLILSLLAPCGAKNGTVKGHQPHYIHKLQWLKAFVQHMVAHAECSTAYMWSSSIPWGLALNERCEVSLFFAFLGFLVLASCMLRNIPILQSHPAAKTLALRHAATDEVDNFGIHKSAMRSATLFFMLRLHTTRHYTFDLFILVANILVANRCHGPYRSLCNG